MQIKKHQLQQIANGERRIMEAAKSAREIWDFKENALTGSDIMEIKLRFNRKFKINTYNGLRSKLPIDFHWSFFR